MEPPLAMSGPGGGVNTGAHTEAKPHSTLPREPVAPTHFMISRDEELHNTVYHVPRGSSPENTSRSLWSINAMRVEEPL